MTDPLPIKYGHLPLTPIYGQDEVAGGGDNGINFSESKLPDPPLPADSVYQVIKNELLMDVKPGLNLATFCNEAYTDPWGMKIVSDSIKKNFIDYTEYPGTILTEKRSIRMIARELGTTFDEPDPTDPHKEAKQGFYGTATIGSSEAIMLGLIAHKFIWSLKHRVLLKYESEINTGATNPIKVDPRDRPVVLMSAHVHACWDKFCRYYDAVPLYIPQAEAPYAIHDGNIIKNILNTEINETDGTYKDYAKKIRKLIYLTKDDQETVPGMDGRVIGELVMAVGTCIGTTFTGNSDNVIAPSSDSSNEKYIDTAVDEFCKAQNDKYAAQKTKFEEKYEAEYKQLYDDKAPQRIPEIIDIPIHIDSANGFVLLFSSKADKIKLGFKDSTNQSDPAWTTKRVRSINLSNHKFGMTFTGMGCVIFKDSKVVDPALIYEIPYLGGTFENYTVNFSRGSAMIVMQYYNFLRFGRQGYQAIIGKCLENTKWFLDQLPKTTVGEKKLSDYFKNISNYKVQEGCPTQDPDNNVDLPIIALTWAKGKPGEDIKWNFTNVSDKLAERGWMVPAYTLSVNSPDESVTDGTEVLRVVVQQVVTREKLKALLWDMAEAIEELNKLQQQLVKTGMLASAQVAYFSDYKNKKAIARRTICLC